MCTERVESDRRSHRLRRAEAILERPWTEACVCGKGAPSAGGPLSVRSQGRGDDKLGGATAVLITRRPHGSPWRCSRRVCSGQATAKKAGIDEVGRDGVVEVSQPR
jgi:hypothetical protein